MKEADLRLGIDLGGTKMEGVLLDKSGSVILRRRTPLRPARTLRG